MPLQHGDIAPNCMDQPTGEGFSSPPCFMHELTDEPVPSPALIRIKRVYEPPAGADGARVLVDRLWPRGLKASRAAFDDWLPDVAPSAALRKWFGHEPRRFAEFRRRYRAELRANGTTLEPLRKLTKKRGVTLLYAAKNEHFNHAVVLAEFLREETADHDRARRSSK